MKRLLFFIILVLIVSCDKPELIQPEEIPIQADGTAIARNTILLRLGNFNPAIHDMYTGTWGTETGDVPYYQGIGVFKDSTYQKSTCVVNAEFGGNDIPKNFTGNNCWVWSGDNGKAWQDVQMPFAPFPDFTDQGLVNSYEHTNAAGKLMHKILESHPMIKGVGLTFVGVTSGQHNLTDIYYWGRKGHDLAGVMEISIPAKYGQPAKAAIVTFEN